MFKMKYRAVLRGLHALIIGLNNCTLYTFNDNNCLSLDSFSLIHTVKSTQAYTHTHLNLFSTCAEGSNI